MFFYNNIAETMMNQHQQKFFEYCCPLKLIQNIRFEAIVQITEYFEVLFDVIQTVHISKTYIQNISTYQ